MPRTSGSINGKITTNQRGDRWEVYAGNIRLKGEEKIRRRYRKSFATKGEAEAHRKELEDQRKSDGVEADLLTREQRESARTALNILAPFPGATLERAAEFYRAHLERQRRPLTILEAFHAFLDHRPVRHGKRIKRKPTTVKTLRSRLLKFLRYIDPDAGIPKPKPGAQKKGGPEIPEAGGRYLHTIQPEEIEKFFIDGGYTGDNYNHYFEVIHAFFKWGETRGHCSINPLRILKDDEILAKDTVTHRRKAYYTYQQIQEMLEQAEDKRIRAFIVLSAFAGLRPEEFRKRIDPGDPDTQRMLALSGEGVLFKRGTVFLDWQAINLKDGTLRLEAILSKTKNPRVVPLQPAAIAYLKTIEHREGPVVSGNWTMEWRAWREEHGWKGKPEKGKVDKTWLKDGLRHTYGTYRMAIINNRLQLAEEMGSGPQVTKDHYDSVATLQEAKKFWALRPTA